MFKIAKILVLNKKILNFQKFLNLISKIQKLKNSKFWKIKKLKNLKIQKFKIYKFWQIQKFKIFKFKNIKNL